MITTGKPPSLKETNSHSTWSGGQTKEKSPKKYSLTSESKYSKAK